MGVGTFMSHARFFAKKAEQLLGLAKRARQSSPQDNGLELSLISIANEFMAKAESETTLAKKRKNGK
jgi:hypothetical protein